MTLRELQVVLPKQKGLSCPEVQAIALVGLRDLGGQEALIEAGHLSGHARWHEAQKVHEAHHVGGLRAHSLPQRGAIALGRLKAIKQSTGMQIPSCFAHASIEYIARIISYCVYNIYDILYLI